MLQPLRARFDDDRVPSRRFRLSDFRTTIASVLKAPDLRRLSYACFAFNGVQSVFTAYFVTYLVALGYELAAAGFLFSLVVAVAVPCRILWGWVGSFHVRPRLVMAGLAFGMAGSVALAGLFTPTWPMIAIGLVGAVLSATAMSWHGILLSETARLAPFGSARRRHGGRFVVRSNRCISGPVCFLAAAGPDRRLRFRMGPMRRSRPVGRYKSVAPTLGSGTWRRAHSEDGRDQQEPGVERMRKFFGPLAAEAMRKRPTSLLREAIAKDRASIARDLLGLMQTKQQGETR
jgi:hypothetical protein